MTPALPRRRRPLPGLGLAAFAAAVSLSGPGLARGQSPPPCGPDSCAEARRPGEVAIVMLGDSGYGQGGASEWGGHAQAAVAKRIQGLCPRPDLVFFLGDNIYWGGSPDLFGPRFDTMYRGLFDPERQRVHAALGNHDVKGCQVSGEPGYPSGDTCLDALERALREDISRDVAPVAPESPLAAEAGDIAVRWLDPEVRERARRVPHADCPSAFDAGYEQREGDAETTTCYASHALRHSPFGFGTRGDLPLRYYTVDWPGPGAKGGAADPHVRVLVADSNTLDVDGGLLPASPPSTLGAMPAPRRDALQLLWMENQLRTAPSGAWTLAVMPHPPFTPRGCVFRVFGRCIGGHDDEVRLKAQLRATWGADLADPRSNGPFHPDLVFAAHNHFYSRTYSLDGAGYRAAAPGSGVRYFVTGGGGAPLYRQLPLHARYASAGVFHHFTYLRLRPEAAYVWAIDDRGKVRDSGCFVKGEPVDRCIARGTFSSAVLACGDPAPAADDCPAPAP
ncbi:MAG TPA: metallophosphoesterase [Vicinamibacteria bacterium]|nr:metallophosphoesterase [Vicinamibacteria bacterium]